MDLVPHHLPLDHHPRLLLPWVRRRRLAQDLLPPLLILKVVEVVVPLPLPARHEVVVVSIFDLLQGVIERHPPVYHDRCALGASHPLLQRIQHRYDGGPIGAIALEHLVRLGEAVPIQHQPHHHLLAVRPAVPRGPPLGLGILEALPLEVRGGQVVEEEAALQVEQRPLPLRQGALDRDALRVQPVEVLVERLVDQRVEVCPQQIGQRGASDPVGHGVLGQRPHQPVERHDLREHPRACRQAGPGHHRVHPELLPQLVPHVHRSRLPRLFRRHLIGVHGDEIGRPGGLARSPPRGLHLRDDRVHLRVADQRVLARERDFDLVRER